MVEENVQVGQIVSSIAGRDQERFFIVYKVYKGSLIEVIDGKLRKVERPKKKNIKHIKCYPEILTSVAEKILNNERLSNAEVRKALANSDVVKKFECDG